MQRRDFVTLLVGAAALWPYAGAAQQPKVPTIGFLGVSSDRKFFMTPFRQGLGETGYVEGKNVAFDYRAAHFHYDLLPDLAAELVGRNVDVIVTGSGSPSTLAAKRATSTIPIVFTGVGDPVGLGLVVNLAHPGGNVTGFTNIITELTPKLFELLLELVPRAGVIALLVNPTNPNAELLIGDAQAASHAKGVQLAILKASTESEIDAAFAAFVQLQAGGLVVEGDAYFESRREQIVALASRDAIPAAYARRVDVAAGGLISYGIDDTASIRQAGSYAGRILKGEKPGDLPVQQPTKFELVINLKTAKALGLSVPQSLLARADEVIE